MKLKIKHYIDGKVQSRIIDNAAIGNDGLIDVYESRVDTAQKIEVINMRALNFIGLDVIDPW